MFPVANVYEEMSTRIPGMRFEPEEEELEMGKLSERKVLLWIEKVMELLVNTCSICPEQFTEKETLCIM